MTEYAFVVYQVRDNKVSLPDNAVIIRVQTADQGGLGHNPIIVSVLVAVPLND